MCDRTSAVERDLSTVKINFLLGDVDAMFREFMQAQSSSDELQAKCVPTETENMIKSERSDVSCASTVSATLSSDASIFKNAQATSENGQSHAKQHAAQEIDSATCVPDKPQSQHSDVSCASTIMATLSYTDASKGATRGNDIGTEDNESDSKDSARTTSETTFRPTMDLHQHRLLSCDGLDALCDEFARLSLHDKPKLYAQVVSASLLA